jgi:hypothetical protein
LLYARAVEASGDLDKAIEEYEAVVQGFPGEEARVRYAQLLQRRGHGPRAMAVFEEVVKRTSLAPKYYQRDQRAWVEIAKRTLQSQQERA